MRYQKLSSQHRDGIVSGRRVSGVTGKAAEPTLLWMQLPGIPKAQPTGAETTLLELYGCLHRHTASVKVHNNWKAESKRMVTSTGKMRELKPQGK